MSNLPFQIFVNFRKDSSTSTTTNSKLAKFIYLSLFVSDELDAVVSNDDSKALS